MIHGIFNAGNGGGLQNLAGSADHEDFAQVLVKADP